MTRIATLILTALIAGTATADDLIEKNVSTLTLREQAGATGSVVRLADVLDFTQADPRLLATVGNEAIAEQADLPASVRVTHDQIEQRLAALGVNMARVLISGSWVCDVRLEAPVETLTAHTPPADTEMDTAASFDDPAPLFGPRQSEQPSASDLSLADALQSYIEKDLANLNGKIEVQFERGARQFLELRTPKFSFSIVGPRRQELAWRQYRVTIREDGRDVRTVPISVYVKLLKDVVVAAKPLNIGTVIRPDQIAFAPHVFSDIADVGFDQIEPVVGQQVKQYIPEHQIVRMDQLQSIDLVKRSTPVTIVGGGEISLNLHGDALDNGKLGETVRVRIGSSRKNRRVLRGEVIGVAKVRLLENAGGPYASR